MMKHPVSKSDPPDFPDEQRRLFVEVLELLNDKRVPYVVSGAFALHEHTGIWRDTKDLDLFLPGECVQDALHYLREDGFTTEVADPVWLAKAHRENFFVDLITGMSNAAVTVEMDWIDRSTPAEVLGVPTRVLGPAELIACKLFVTRRERFDGADICHTIFRTTSPVDWDFLMDIVTRHGHHWELLLWHLVLYRYIYPAHAHRVPKRLWDELLERFHEVLAHPDPDAPFRGSLIDENMFAIDVKEWGMENTVEALRAAREHKIPTDAGTIDPFS